MGAAAVLPAAIGAAGSLFGGVFQQQSELGARADAYQTTVKDMTAAGLNPALMFGSGGPMNMPQLPNVVGGAVGSAVQGLQATKQLELMEAQKQATLQKAFKDMTDGLVSQQDLIIPGSDPSGPTYRGLLNAARIALVTGQTGVANSAAALNRAALPAEQITGSKVGGILNLFGKGASSAASLYGGRFAPFESPF